MENGSLKLAEDVTYKKGVFGLLCPYCLMANSEEIVCQVMLCDFCGRNYSVEIK